MNLEQLYMIASGHHQSGRLVEAIPLYEQLLQMAPDIHDVRSNLAAAHISLGQDKEAQQHLTHILAAMPNHIDALINMGNLQSKYSEKKALAYFQKAQKIAPQRADIPFNIAMMYHEKNAIGQAKKMYRACLEVQSDMAQALINLAMLLIQEGQEEEAEQLLKYCIEKHPNHPEALLNMAHIQYSKGAMTAAETYYREAYATADQHPFTINALGKFLTETEQYTEAIAILEKPSSKEADTQLLLGNAYTAAGDSEKAIAIYESLLEAFPQHKGVQRNLAKLLQKKMPGWHFSMLADEARNEAYDKALRAAVTAGDRVLDIGTGSGLLAMMAARAGAAKVDACEMVPTVADAAKVIVAQNQMSDKINIICEKSLNLSIGNQMEAKADLLVSEILDAGLLGEGVLPTLRHANTFLVKEDAIVIPQKATLRASLVSLPKRKKVHPIQKIAGFDLSYFNRFQSPDEYKTIHLLQEEHQILSEPFVMETIDFQHIPPAIADNEAQESLLETQILSDGTVDAVVFWFDLQVYQDIQVSTHPEGDMKHWGQAVYYLEERKVRKGEKQKIRMFRTDTMIQFAW